MVITFEHLNLDQTIINAINELGFQSPTEVQQIVIPELLNNTQDIVCLAQTGTGKTAAFGLPLLNDINTASGKVQALILSPTRELCRQITADLKNYGKYIRDLGITAVYGGASIESQIKAIKKGCHVVVATPGRMKDLLDRGVVDISGIRTLILDEADEMLNMGFKEELDSILDRTPNDRRTMLFSATMPLEIEIIAGNYMGNPKIITVGTRNSGAENVKHYYYIVQAKDRYLALKRIADFNPDIYAMIFCRTRQETQEVADSLIKDGYEADSLHGELSQAQRDLVMKRFKNRNLSLLVATDVAARGIDVSNLTHVINYNLPDDIEQYTHRSGRTGRADKNGISIAIINSKEQHKIRQIEKVIGKSFALAKVPTGEEVCSKQMLHLLQQVEKTEIRKDIDEYLNIVSSKWKGMSKDELIMKMLSIEFNRFLDYYRNAPDLNIKEASGQKRDSSGKDNDHFPPAERGCSWLKINMGYRANITPRHILRLFSSCGIPGKNVGKIDIAKEYSLVSVSSNVAEYLLDYLNGSDYRGKVLKVEKQYKDETSKPETKRKENRDHGKSSSKYKNGTSQRQRSVRSRKRQ